MNASRRSALILVAGLLSLLLLGGNSAHPVGQAFQPDVRGKSPESPLDPLALIADPRTALQLRAATDYVQEEDWKNALALLQHVLDGEPDVLVLLSGRDGKPDRYISAHAEVERLLSAMPEAGRKVYQRKFGPRAAELSEQARKEWDGEQLARIVRRYLYTEAGPAALQALARQHYRAGRLHLAARCYEKLLDHLGPARWTNDDLYQATAAFHHCGKHDAADLTLKQLLARSRQNVVRLGKRGLSVAELRKEIARAAPPRVTAHWPMYRGNAARSAQVAGGVPLLEPIWRQPLSFRENNAANQRLRQAEKWMHAHHRPILSAFSPIAATVARREKRVPMVFHKNYWGVVVREAKTGEVVWASPSGWSLERLLDAKADPSRQKALTGWLRYYESRYPQILFENSLVGTLSTDGRFVYVIEDLAVPPPPLVRVRTADSAQSSRPKKDKEDRLRRLLEIRVATDALPMWAHSSDADPNLYGWEVQEAIAHSRLQVFDVRSGKLVNEMPRPDEEKGPLSGCYFLGPPLPLDDRLYLLVEKKQEICLVRIDPDAKFKIVSIQPLVRAPQSLLENPIRRTRAAHLAYSDGILVCPTHAGVLLGVDVLTGGVVWAYPYRMPPAETLHAPQEDSKAIPAAPPRDLGPRDIPPAKIVAPGGMDQATPPPSFDEFLGHAFKNRSRNKTPQPVDRRANAMTDWTACAPVLAGGKVVFTPSDHPSIHCLNLRDGSLVWSWQKKADDLYLGGVCDGKVLIVGARSVRALSLASGEILWTLETGTPSGQGIAGDGVYYLPLKEAIHSKQPEIQVIDMNKGRIVARARSRPRTPGGKDFDVPGNLLFFEGKLLSLTPWEIAAYPLLQQNRNADDADAADQRGSDPR